ncbi:MAG: hypothetical protein ACM3KT_08790, partial [Deltaproteobacteria bacterium]
RNEFHVRELYRDELLALLAPHFPQVRLYGQKLLFQSAIWNLDAPPRSVAAVTWSESAPAPHIGLDYAPLYFIAVCSRRPLPDLPDASLFGDREESVYAHYNNEVRRMITADGRIVELEAEVARLRGELEKTSPRR